MTDDQFKIIEAEILLSIASIMKRHGVEHDPRLSAVHLHKVPVASMPPLSRTRQLDDEADAGRSYLAASAGFNGLKMFSEDLK